MAITGDERDRAKRKFMDGVTMELQQSGTLLSAVVTIEPGVMGERTSFDRMAKLTQATEITEAFAPRALHRANYERRYVTPRAVESVYSTPMLDIIKMAENPLNDLVRSAAMEIGRKKDSVIYAAFGGTAGREVNGAASNASFDSANTILVNTNTYGRDGAGAALSGDTGLHTGKLILAKQKLMAAHVDPSRQEIFVVANAKQLTKLLDSLNAQGNARKDFISKTPLNIPGIDLALDGFLGMRFVHYEDVGIDANSDEYVYVLTRDAVKLGVWKDVSVEVDRRIDIEGSPDVAVTSMTIGAVRMDEAQIVRIACDPA